MFRQKPLEEAPLLSSDYYSLYKDLESVINSGIRISNSIHSSLADWEGSRFKGRELQKAGAHTNYALSWICTLAGLVLRPIDEPERIVLRDKIERSTRIVTKQKEQLEKLKTGNMPVVPDLVIEPQELARKLLKLHLQFNNACIRHKRSLSNVPKSTDVFNYADKNLKDAHVCINQVM